MKDFLEKIVRKKAHSSSSTSSPPPRYSRLSCDAVNDDDNVNHPKHEIRRGYVPVMVGMCEEEKERFMVPCRWMKHPYIVALLQLSANEFGYHQQGVIHIPCEPHHFKDIMENISSSK
ncbi:hypothetical protein BVRB_1g017840 [Beta vulgaris subsp. vulgaris]|uniref:auxin-responsive protein SAUR71 n=1 Tax=Beta vulgaris subsp. vulgaris TaxID=3555 RepID=UPI00053FDABE|nr:auxin-responsive protein SAUR71 [Beta vulgaris subsp. vulgaris]KMS99939.1 hypothetical protein BVRB_1g017840 [Beta vulgaris subsp. vulgaris]